MAIVGKGEIANLLAEKSEISAAQAGRIVNALLDCIAESLKNGDVVRLTGFGTFRVIETKERGGRHPQTNEPIVIPAGRRVGFSTSAKLKDSVS